ncbi:MAG: TetR/AcrR family transcriptional regulator [Deltaproteobacteria bacterium]|nr:TetR/AcrR family transcriptional regulator [Kofleriaceae bacterium]
MPVTEGKRIRAKRPGRFHHGDLRDALVLAATRAVAKLGHANVSLRPLAEQLGVSQPAVYRHFASREALLAEVARRTWLELPAALEGAARGARDRFEAATAISRAYVRWAHANPELFRLLSSRFVFDQREGPLPPLPREHYFQGLGGAVPIDDPMLADAFRASWAMSHGLATFVVERVFQLVDSDEERLAAADGAITCFVEMLRAKWPAA